MQLSPLPIKFYGFTFEELSNYQVPFTTSRGCTHTAEEDPVIHSSQGMGKRERCSVALYSPTIKVTLLIQFQFTPRLFIAPLTAGPQMNDDRQAAGEDDTQPPDKHR